MTTQLDCSIGLKAETTWGTAITVDQFVEFLSETFDYTPDFLQGKGLRVGARVDRAGRRSVGKIDAGGNVVMEAPVKGLGAFLAAAFGSVTNTAVPSQSGVYQQVHTPTTSDPLPSYTIQKGIPPLGGGATTALTMLGSVCSSIEFAAKQGDILQVTSEWTSRELRTDIAYATPAYPANLDVFTYVQGAITIGGSPTPPTTTAPASGGTAVANVGDFSMKWDNGLDGAGWNMGGAGRRTRKAAVGKGKLTGKLTAEYSDTSLRDAFMNQTTLALVLTFTHTSTIGTSAHPLLQFHVPGIKLDGGAIPQSNGGDVIATDIDFSGLDTQSGPPISVVYVSTDTAP